MESIRIKPTQLFVSHKHRKTNQVLSAKDGNGKSDPDDFIQLNTHLQGFSGNNKPLHFFDGL